MSEPADAPTLVVVDNYDSFTFNLVHALEIAGARCRVVANDAARADELLALRPDGYVISAGPCTPDEAGVSLALAAALLDDDRAPPLLGVCLGHQVIARALGGRIVRATKPVHGKVVRINHDGRGLFEGLDTPLLAARYNSLMVDANSLASVLEPSAQGDDGELMAFRHRSRSVIGLQFHPESILSRACRPMFARWTAICRHQPCEALAARAG